ncbi:MAG TPA: cold-shock protein [Gammaproteobacteria bacterium]|nr:cold-shock protein [Gammaproteobacteria bacterium]|tara:strand:- start:10 stop:216 length:207 start_codon:yes stop_codon:yes gene_type:complete
MITGTVKWFNKTKGFGFVSPEDGGKDIFVHISAVEASGLDTLHEDQVVNMETEMSQKGPQATKITIPE